MNRSLWTALALAGAALGPVACGETETPAETAPDAPAGIAASNGRLMLPAVKGNPAAAYFELSNTGDRDMTIRAASVLGASSAMMHSTTETGMVETLQAVLKAGETLKFEPGGEHVMVHGLPDTVVPGGQVEVTVTFLGGDKISFPAEARAAGDAR